MTHQPHPYDNAFFRNLETESLKSAQQIVPLLLHWLAPKSVVDVGCGVGSWLSVFRDSGIEDILGIDGDYVNRDALLIPPSSFIPFDLRRPLQLSRRFDLVVSVEVAEHLPQQSAASFVRSLVSLGDVVVFSAAVPKQGWDNGLHLNEQWPDYWVQQFRRVGYDVIDCIRSRIWTNDHVCWWYAQNMLMFVNHADSHKYEYLRSFERNDAIPRSIVHPRFLRQYADFDGMSLQRKMWLINRAARSLIPGILRRFSRIRTRRDPGTTSLQPRS